MLKNNITKVIISNALKFSCLENVFSFSGGMAQEKFAEVKRVCMYG